MKYDFPFVGAGHAEYFEWFNLMIVFKKAPLDQQVQSIIASAPSIIKPLAEDFLDDSLEVGSDQYINFAIEREYGKKSSKKKESLHEASQKACDAFEKDLVQWLKNIHSICPIEVVCRPEDQEAGGTDLSQWHDLSGEMMIPVVKKWLKLNLKSDEAAIKRQILQSIALYYFEDSDDFEIAGLIGPLLEYVMDEYLFLTYRHDDLHSDLLETPEALRGLESHVIQRGVSVPDTLSQMILFALSVKSTPLLAALHKEMKNKSSDDFQWLNYYWHRDMLSVDGFTLKSAEAYWFLMDALIDYKIPIADLTLYNNILVHCIPEGDRKNLSDGRMKAAISLCQPFADQNPLIHFNLLTLKTYMKDWKGILKHAKAYFASNDPNKERLKECLKKNEEYADFRSQPELKAWLLTL